MWTMMYPIIVGDQNLDRLRTDKMKGKLLLDVEDVYNFKCLITEPTSDFDQPKEYWYCLTTRPDTFISDGINNPELSDYVLDAMVKH